MSNEEIKMPEIKPGYIVKDTLGRFLLVVSPKLAYVLTRTVNEDLNMDALTDSHWTHSDKTICIYGCPNGGWFTVADLKDIVYDNNDRYVLWWRTEPIKEITMAELEDHFGCKVKIVKDK